MNNRFILVLDHDGIIHPNELLEEYIKEIDFRATKEYHDELIRLMEERELTKEKFDLMMMEHYYVKDQVLEEVLENFKGRIPYEMIYTIENAYHDVVKTIKFVHDCHAFDEIFLNSHRNCLFEKTSKDNFHGEYLPFIRTFYPPFHVKPFDPTLENLWDNNDRERTDKGIYLMKQLGITNLKGFYAVDDSLSICKEYERCGAKAFYKKPTDSSIDVIIRAAGAAFDDRRALESREGRGAYTKRR